MKTTGEHIRLRLTTLSLILFWALAGVAPAQDVTITNLAQLADVAFSGGHSISLPWTPWQWHAYSLDGGEPWWVDCSQLPCAELFQATNLSTSYEVSLVPVVLAKNVLTGEVTLQPNGATDIVARVAAPNEYQPGALSEDRAVWSMWQEWTNCPDCWGEPDEGIVPPTVTLKILLADSNDYATYQSNLEAEAQAQAEADAASAASFANDGSGRGMMMLTDEDESCTITNENDPFAILNIAQDGDGNTTVNWASCSDHLYEVQTADDLSTQTVWAMQAAMIGSDGTTSWTDTTSPGIDHHFYRVLRQSSDDDFDGDGIPNGWEIANGLDPLDSNDASYASSNPWAHGLTNFQVYENPSVLISNNYTTFNDGIPDWWRVMYFGTSTTTNSASCAACDPDGDGLTNLQECQLGTNPMNPDTDGDSIPDGWEAAHGLNPLDPSDGAANLMDFELGTGSDQLLDVAVNGSNEWTTSLTVSVDPLGSTQPRLRISYGDPNLWRQVLPGETSPYAVVDNPGRAFTITLPDQGDGSYDLYFQYLGTNGVSVGPILHKHVTLDRVAPVVAITSPAGNAVLDQAFITLQGAAFDPDPVQPPDARPLKIWINDNPYWGRSGTNITIKRFPVPSGTNAFTVTIRAVDAAGNTNTASQTWTVDPGGDTTAPQLSSFNIATSTLLPDVSTVWVEGAVDDSNALVTAIVSSDSGDVTTNALNVYNLQFEGLVPLESGTNTVVLLAADAAGNVSSNVFTVISSSRYRFAITSPAFGDFATAPSNYVSGYVGALFDEGLPTQTNVQGVVINGVAAMLGTNIDADGNLSFTTTNAIPVGVPITGYLVGDGIPTNPPPDPPTMSQVYEVTVKTSSEDHVTGLPDGGGFVLWPDWCNGSWYAFLIGQYLYNSVYDLSTIADDTVQGTIYNQINESVSGCTAPVDPDDLAWGPYFGGDDPPASFSEPVRSLSFGTYRANGLTVFDAGNKGIPAEKDRVTSSVTFRAPRQYDTNTTVIFTFEGMDTRCYGEGVLDLSQVKYRGQRPIAWNNEAQTASYLITVDGGKEYTINQDSFEWPTTVTNYSERYVGHL